MILNLSQFFFFFFQSHFNIHLISTVALKWHQLTDNTSLSQFLSKPCGKLLNVTAIFNFTCTITCIHIPSNSHTSRSKTLISHLLTPTDQFLTPSRKVSFNYFHNVFGYLWMVWDVVRLVWKSCPKISHLQLLDFLVQDCLTVDPQVQWECQEK